MPNIKNGLNSRKQPDVLIDRGVYAMTLKDGVDAEITMYGDVVESRPIDWWTGKPMEGDFIILDEFLEDFETISKAKNITIRMNSYGGDCVVAFVIHNKLRDLARAGVKTTCIVDGVAMSAGSVIMSACDTVKVNAASLVMIHRCWSFLWGGYNADELRGQADSQDAYDKALAAAYVRKTGLSQTQILHMMSETTYMTGSEAIEKGFADELVESAEPLNLAASADGRSIFVRGKEMHLAPGMFAPDMIPTIEQVSPEDKGDKEAAPEDSVITNNIQPEETGSVEGGQTMSKDELRAQYPDLVAEIEADATAGQTEAINAAVQAERSRLQGIDEVANLFPDSLVNAAKYGEQACTAQEMTLRAAQDAVKEGKNFLNALDADTKESHTNDVNPAVAPEDGGNHEMTQEECDAAFAALLKEKEE